MWVTLEYCSKPYKMSSWNAFIIRLNILLKPVSLKLFLMLAWLMKPLIYLRNTHLIVIRSVDSNSEIQENFLDIINYDDNKEQLMAYFVFCVRLLKNLTYN